MDADADGLDPQVSGSVDHRPGVPDAVDQVKLWLTEQRVDPSVLEADASSRAERAYRRAERADLQADRADRQAERRVSGDQASRTDRSTWRARRRSDEADDTPPMTDAEAEELARAVVLRKLNAQARTRQELAKALDAKDVPDEIADAVLDRMEEVGLVNDAEFAECWVVSRQSRRHLSKSALRRELSSKGVAKDQIDSALDSVDPDDEYAAASALADKKFRSMSGLQREVQYRRLSGALARRGFNYAVTSRVLSEVLDDTSR